MALAGLQERSMLQDIKVLILILLAVPLHMHICFRNWGTSLSYEGMTDEQIFFSDYKEYESGGTKYSIGNINAYDEKSVKELAERMQDVFPSVLASTGMDMAFAQINVIHDDVSFTCLIPSDDAAAQVLEAAFHNTAVHEGIWFRIEPCAARKKDVVPAITNVLNRNGK